MTTMTPIEAALRKEGYVAAAALVAVTVLAWLYLFSGAGTGMSALAMSGLRLPEHGTAHARPDFAWAIMAAMWWVMMIAMMVPSAAPTILLYGRVCRHRPQAGDASGTCVAVACFLLGYLLAWLGFSLAATGLQAAMEKAGLLDGMMMWITHRVLSAGFLLAAGLYQLSPLKAVCLDHCRAPVAFLARNWRPGAVGALRMGLRHGTYCVGCCWLLMALLFVGGAMNLVWIAGLSLLVLVEKLTPFGGATARLTGIVLIAGAVFVLSGA